MVGAQRGDLAKDAIISVVVRVALLFGAWWWDAKLQARQDALGERNRRPSGWPGPRLGQSG